jgi:zinc protease
MTRFRVLATILLALAPAVTMAQKKSPAKPAPQKSRPAATPAAAGEIFPFPVTEKTLANGLKVMVVQTGFPNIVSIQIPVQTGSRNEVEPGKSGFAHFFEHMMFRGTKAYPPEKYQEILTKVGARQNAFTTNDFTNYHTTFSKEDLDLMLKVEADRFMNLD